MRKLLFLFVLLPLISTAQKFEAVKMISAYGNTKVKGTVVVTDKTVTLDLNKTKKVYDIYDVEVTDTHTLYYATFKGLKNTKYRFTLSENNIYKKAPFSLTVDTVDGFKGQTVSYTYTLKQLTQ